MHLNNIGKKITQVKFSKNKVIIKISDKSKIVTSFEVYQKFHLKEGQEISDIQIKKINESNLYEKCREYLLKITAKHEYSEKEIERKLKLKGISSTDIKSLIKYLKELNLINDDNYVLDYVRVYSKKNLSINKLKSELIKKGIPPKEVNKLKSSYKEEIKKASQLINKKKKMFSKCSFMLTKQKLFNYLKQEQFENNVIEKVINENVIYNHDEEIKKLRIEYSIIYTRYRYKYLGDLLYLKVIQYLLRKGFTLEDIKIVERDYKLWN